MYADILIELKAKGIDQTFTYKIPDEFISKVKCGIRVLVPFGKQKLEGFVLQIHQNKPEFDCKDIISLIDEEVILNDELISLGKYMSKKVLCNLILCYQSMLPKALKAKNETHIKKQYKTYLKLNLSYEDAIKKIKNEKQKQIIDKLKDTKIEKKELLKISASSIQTLYKNNILTEEKEEIYRKKWDKLSLEKPNPLTEEQNKVFKEIKKHMNTFYPFLLYGVTGSGKTEVYMHLIEEVKKENKCALILVPEISLTPQLTHMFQKRFGEDIAILHSKLSDGERYDEWRRIARGEVSIAIGARSAVFAPLKNIGIIIVDEEHSSTYKQENNPKYHTIDIAIKRSKYHKCPLVLGSATPSIENYTRAKLNIFHLLEMKTRVNKNLPKVTLVDMKEEIKEGYSLFSRLLTQKIEEKLSKNEQVILLLNRRGYTTVVTCKNCGFTQKCPHCDIPLTYHKASNTMRCHYCGYGTFKINVCPECQSRNINEFGLGTQKLEEEVEKKFKARVLRMDADTTSLKDAYEKMIQSFKNHEYDVLIGTQMIAKGLNFPLVTLVGVLNIDASLQIPDFRSSERTYQLLSQVAGRAGRFSLHGEVIFQGFNMDHYSVKYASIHDYEGFYQEEIKIRKMLQYPPYTELILLKMISKDENTLKEESQKIKNYLERKKQGKILGPTPSNLYKLNDRYHYQIMIKIKNKKDLYSSLIFLKDKYKDNKKFTLEIDVNPLKVS